ncbi:MAG TPA: response regulator [Terriglobales bacterium]|nr:response regulator [Terriglobales bacterium]
MDNQVVPSSPANRVLLIDDDPLQLRVREAVLRDAGLEVDVATTAETALGFLRTEAGDRIGAIVTDHVMPGASGAVFVRALRELKPKVPVIVISGMADAEEEYEGLNVFFRMKPCPPPELIRLVRTSLPKAK